MMCNRCKNNDINRTKFLSTKIIEAYCKDEKIDINIEDINELGKTIGRCKHKINQ